MPQQRQRPTLRILRLSPPPYQIDFSTATTGRHLPTTKRRVRFRFGFADPHSLSNNLTGINCRGEEHEIQLVWSVASGKRRILLDGVEVHRSYRTAVLHSGGVALPPDGGKFAAGFDMNGGEHHVEVIAHAHPPGCPFGDVRKRERQYDMKLDGQSFFDFPHIYELGLGDHHGVGPTGRSFTYRNHGNRDLAATAPCGSAPSGTLTSPRSQPVDDISVRYRAEEDDYETYDGIPSRFDPSNSERSFACPSPPTWEEQREYDRAYYDAERVKASRNFPYRGDLNSAPHVVKVPPKGGEGERMRGGLMRRESGGSSASTLSQLSCATGGTSSRTERVTATDATGGGGQRDRGGGDPEPEPAAVPEVATADLLHLEDYDATGGPQEGRGDRRSSSAFQYLHEAFSSSLPNMAGAAAPATPDPFPSATTSHSHYPPYTGEGVGYSGGAPSSSSSSSSHSPSRSVADEILGGYFKRPTNDSAVPPANSGPPPRRSAADEILGGYFQRPDDDDARHRPGPDGAAAVPGRQRRWQQPPWWSSSSSARAAAAAPSLRPVAEEKKEGGRSRDGGSVGGGGGSEGSSSTDDDEDEDESPQFVVHRGDGRGGGDGDGHGDDALDAALRKLVDLNDMGAGAGSGGGGGGGGRARARRRRNSIPPASGGVGDQWQQEAPSLERLRFLNGHQGGMGGGDGDRLPVMGGPPPPRPPPPPPAPRPVPYTYY